MRGRWRVLSILLALYVELIGCGSPRAFKCASDTDCVNGAVPGRCERDGYCSFPDVSCPAGSRYGEHAPAGVRDACVESQQNDACEAASTLVLGETATGELRAAASTGLVTCSPAAVSDVYYQLTLDECSDVTLRAESANGNVGVALVRDCAETLGCADAAQTTGAETATVFAVPAGTYQIAVAGIGYDGDFSVTASIAPAPAHDTIDGALELSSDATRVDSLAGATDHISCDGRVGGRDVVYKISVPTRAVLDISLTGHLSSDFAVALLTTSGTELRCESASSGDARFYEVDAGEYLLAVDGPIDGSCEQFDLSLTTLRVPNNNRCVTPETIGCIPKTATVLDDLDNQDLIEATNDSVGTCGGSGGDVVYALPIGGPTNLRITVERGGSFSPVVYLRPMEVPLVTSCIGAAPADEACLTAATTSELQHQPKNACTPGMPGAQLVHKPTEFGCATGTSKAVLELEAVPAGWYYLIVDSDGGTGTFDLLVERPRPTGDFPGTQLTAGCFDNEESGCCEIESTVNAAPDAAATSCAVSGTPDLFRHIAVENGCFITGSFVIVGTVPHGAEMTFSGTCPGVPASTCKQASDAVLGIDGQYRTYLPINMNDGATSCQLRARVFAPSDPTTRGPVEIHYQNAGFVVCNP
jgi:hypothetical protein